MSLRENLKEESICHCAGRKEFFSFKDCQHIITTDPKLLAKEFPILFDLCKKGGRYRTQISQISDVDIWNSIEQFLVGLRENMVLVGMNFHHRPTPLKLYLHHS